MCRILGKALYENSLLQNSRFQICSMYDQQTDADENLYFPSEYFRGYGIQKFRFFKEMVQKGRGFDVVMLSHVNLLPIGWMIKKISPKTRIILLAHGIEIWYPLPARRRNMLANCDRIFAVSRFTADTIETVHEIPGEKIKVLNNCLDPFLPSESTGKKAGWLMQKYGIRPNDKVLMTLTRISSKERYKGYEKVIAAMAALVSGSSEHAEASDMKYLIAGSYDDTEKQFLEEQIQKNGLIGKVLMPGYIADEDLEAHFLLADAYIMPSLKEGFGIVFIEAMHYGLPVIAGNRDGSVDALDKGGLGQLVDPDDNVALQHAMTEVLANPEGHQPDPHRLKELFSYESYKNKLEEFISWG